jgi:hypothetical protein
MHSRRRRIEAPSLETRESITLSSKLPHLGQRILTQGMNTENYGLPQLMVFVNNPSARRMWIMGFPEGDFMGKST